MSDLLSFIHTPFKECYKNRDMMDYKALLAFEQFRVKCRQVETNHHCRKEDLLPVTG